MHQYSCQAGCASVFQRTSGSTGWDCHLAHVIRLLGNHMVSPHWQNAARQTVLCTGPCPGRAATNLLLRTSDSSFSFLGLKKWAPGTAVTPILAPVTAVWAWARHKGVCKPEAQPTNAATPRLEQAVKEWGSPEAKKSICIFMLWISKQAATVDFL